jgi:hypothetical protein
MTLAELNQALKAIGYPVAYSHFEDTPQNPAPKPPFIVYREAYSSDLMADNRNYVDIPVIQIELYTDKKDLAAEAAVQNKLKGLGLPYSKTEMYIEDERLFQVIYEIQLIGG